MDEREVNGNERDLQYISMVCIGDKSAGNVDLCRSSVIKSLVYGSNGNGEGRDGN